MLIEASIRNHNQIAKKAALWNATFVSSHQQDGPPLEIKSNSNAPYAPIGAKVKFLHVGVTRTLERIYLQPSQHGPFFAKDCCRGYPHFLNRLRQFPVFRG